MKPEEIKVTERPITIGEYFSKTQYQIPIYQREYVWSEKIVEDFLEELISDKDFEHTFFGIIILKKTRISGQLAYEVIDGQQRSISFSLILKLLSIYANSFLSENNRVQLKLKEIKDLLITGKTPVVRPSRNDSDLYKSILESDSAEELEETLKRNKEYSKRHLYKNTVKIFQYLKDESLTVVSWLRVIESLLTKVYVITITVDSPKNANQLFKSFNQKRVTLLLSDLLRNDVYLCGLKHDFKEEKIIGILEKLNDIFKEISKSNKVGTEEFLFYFINAMGFTVPIFNARSKDRKPLSNNKLYSAFEWILNAHYKKNLSKFITDLRDTWETLLPLMDPESMTGNYFIGKEGRVRKEVYEEFVYLYALRSFNIKKGAHVILAAKKNLSRRKYLDVLRTTTIFTIQHTFTPRDMKSLERWLAEASSELFRTGDPKIYKKKLKKNVTLQYEKSVSRNFSFYEFSNARAKALLLLIHLKDRGFRHILVDKFNDIEIEHIWPDKPTDKLVREIGINRSVYDASKRYLGNLLLCHQSINAEAKNKPFGEKQSIYCKRHKRMYSVSGFIIRRHEWNVESINQRTKELQDRFSSLL